MVVASIYVNPTQFSANEDFDVYPRNPEGDRKSLQDAGCAAVFEPTSLYVSGAMLSAHAHAHAARRLPVAQAVVCHTSALSPGWWVTCMRPNLVMMEMLLHWESLTMATRILWDKGDKVSP